MLAGGTGIYPFLDLLDLAYKHHLCAVRPSLRKAIVEDNPLVSSDLFEKFTFRVFAAFRSIDEIHPIVLQQWIELSASKSVQISLRIGAPFNIAEYPRLTFT